MFRIEKDRMFLTRGDTATMSIDLYDAAGVKSSVKSSDVVTLTVRDIPGGSLIFQVSNAVGETGIEIVPTDTKNAAAGTYSASVTLKRGTKVYTIWPTTPYDTAGNIGNFILEPEVGV